MAEATKTKFDTKKETGELTLTRTLIAPREKVWAAYSDSEALKQWWGPRTFPTTYSDLEFKEGGYWLYCMTGPDGTEAWGKMLYHEIDEPSKIVYTDVFSDKDGNVNEELPASKTVLTFEEAGDGKTKLVSHTKFASPEDLQQVIDMGMREGIDETYDKLDEYLAAQK